MPVGLWGLPALLAWQREPLAGRRGWCHTAGRCSAQEHAASARGTGTCHELAGLSAQGARHRGTSAIHPPVVLRTHHAWGGSRGCLLRWPRDLTVPRLALLLTTFPTCTRASIVLPPPRLPPPQHVPPAPPAPQPAFGAGSRPRAPSRPIVSLPAPGDAGPASLAPLPRWHRTGTGSEAGGADLDLSERRINPPRGCKALRKGFWKLPAAKVSRPHSSLALSVPPCGARGAAQAQGDDVHLRPSTSASRGTSAPPLSTELTVAPAASGVAGGKPPWLTS